MQRLIKFYHNPKEAILAFMCIVFFSLGMGVVVPAWVSYCNNTLYEENILAKLKTNAKNNPKLHDYYTQIVAHKALHEKQLAMLDTLQEKLVDPKSILGASDIEVYIKLHSYVRQLSSVEPEVRVAPYYLDDIMPLWPLFYGFMLTTAVFLCPQSKKTF